MGNNSGYSIIVELHFWEVRALERNQVSRLKMEPNMNQLLDQLIQETQIFSDPNQLLIHPIAIDLIKNGKESIPIILHKMNETGHYLGLLLSEITGENPVLPEHRGIIKEMIQDWNNWSYEGIKL